MKTFLIDEELRDKLALVTENGIFDYCQRLRDLPEAPKASTEDWLDNVIADDRLPPNHAVINGKLVCFNASQTASPTQRSRP